MKPFGKHSTRHARRKDAHTHCNGMCCTKPLGVMLTRCKITSQWFMMCTGDEARTILRMINTLVVNGKKLAVCQEKFVCESRADWSITSDAVTWAGLNSGIQWRFFIKYKIPPGKGVSMSHGASQWRRIWKWRWCYQRNAFLETICFPAIQFGNVVISELWLLYYYS